VGKTAIVEGLALRIARKEVPPELQDNRVLELNLADMLSGTAFRGELEQRIRKFTEELEAMGDKTLLFIDEIHMIHQVKGVEGGLNLSDMLKPALARGKLAIIGATTWHEFQASLQKDPAIERRFQPVIVGEPSKGVAVEILRHLKKGYEDHHKVAIDDGAIVAAVELTQQYIRNRFLPDKAMDAIDEAAAKAAIDGYLGHRTAAGALGQAAEDAAARIGKERGALEEEMRHLKDLEGRYAEDIAIRSAEHALEEHIGELAKEEGELRQRKTDRPTVTAEDVRKVLDAWRAYMDAAGDRSKEE
jgi:ATP-dependent Clp protease ATP-binding subunit ClpC